MHRRPGGGQRIDLPADDVVGRELRGELFGKAAGQQQEAVAAALEQAERVIGQVRLLREYLDAELAVPAPKLVALAPALRGVVEQVSSVAALNQVRFKIVGTSSARIALPESRLRLALQYLLGTVMEGVSTCTVALHFEEPSSESLLRARVERNAGSPPHDRTNGRSQRQPDSPSEVSRKVKLAIATRILESAGASLTVGGSSVSDVILRIPRHSSRPV